MNAVLLAAGRGSRLEERSQGLPKCLLHSSYPDAIAIQRKSQFEDEEMKVQLQGDRIVRIDKGLSSHEAHGESLGVAKFSPTGAAAPARAMQSLIIQGREREWAARAFDLMAARYPIFALDVGQLPWIEIDFPHDLDRADALVWAEICTTAPIYAVA